jgi:hypothetical protein
VGNKFTGGFWAFLGGLIVVAIAAVLVRPGSQAPALAYNLFHGGAELFTAAEGGQVY